jgi:hypothetical protein
MFVPESCVVHREVWRGALTGVPIGQPSSRERILVLGADAFHSAEGNMIRRATASARATRRGQRPWHVGTLFVREPGDLQSGRFGCCGAARIGKARSRSR